MGHVTAASIGLAHTYTFLTKWKLSEGHAARWCTVTVGMVDSIGLGVGLDFCGRPILFWFNLIIPCLFNLIISIWFDKRQVLGNIWIDWSSRYCSLTAIVIQNIKHNGAIQTCIQSFLGSFILLTGEGIDGSCSILYR
jgi:hypothetical protein